MFIFRALEKIINPFKTMSFVPHHEMSFHMPNVAHGRINLNPGPMLAGVVNVADTRRDAQPNISGLVVNPREHLTLGGVNVVKVACVPATKVPLGMVQLERR